MPTRTLLLTSLLPLTVACGEGLSADTGAGADGMSSADQAVADQLWADIAGYENWNQHEDWVGVHLSEDGTHGTHVQIWFNGAAADSLAAGGDGMEDGSILVKEGYSSDDSGDLNAITVMKKDAGGWLWARYDNTGDATMAGDVAASFCEGCHAVGKDNIRFVAY